MFISSALPSPWSHCLDAYLELGLPTDKVGVADTGPELFRNLFI